MQYSYSVYGFNIQSEIPLDATPTSGEIDIYIQYACIMAPKQLEEIEGGFFGFIDAMPYLCWNCVGACLIKNDHIILFEPEPGVSEHMLSLFLLGPAFTLLLQQRGFTVLHGSVVEFDGNAVAFLGDSGAGKSTLAAAFYKRGRNLLADDLLVVSFDGEQPYVMPGPSQLRLLPESIRYLGYDDMPRYSIRTVFDKQAFIVTNSPHSLPLRQIYVLSDQVEEVSQLLPRRSAFLVLARYYFLYAIALLKATKGEVQLLQCARLAKAVPVRYLRRHAPLSVLPELDDYIVKHLERVSTLAPNYEIF